MSDNLWASNYQMQSYVGIHMELILAFRLKTDQGAAGPRNCMLDEVFTIYSTISCAIYAKEPFPHAHRHTQVLNAQL